MNAYEDRAGSGVGGATRSAFRVHFGLLVCLVLVACGDTPDEDDIDGAQAGAGLEPNRELATKLRECDVITTGVIGSAGPSTGEECYQQCLVAVDSCEDLSHLFCGIETGSTGERDFLDCWDRCESQAAGFRCNDGTTIEADYRCDFEADCNDGEDELDCEDHFFACDDGELIYVSYWCDTYVDCEDGSDEGPTCARSLCEDELGGGDGDGDGTGGRPTTGGNSGAGGRVSSGGVTMGSGGRSSDGGSPNSGGAGGTGGTEGDGGTSGSGGTADGGSAGTGGAFACLATEFTVSGGFVDNGTFCGPARTEIWGYDPDSQGQWPGEVNPGCTANDDCFDGPEICASGMLPATTNDPVQFTGVDLVVPAFESRDGSVRGSWRAQGEVSLSWSTGGLTGLSRIYLHGEQGLVYCVDEAQSGTWYDISDFTVECWEAGGSQLVEGVLIDEIWLEIQGAPDEDQTFSDFCLLDFEAR